MTTPGQKNPTKTIMSLKEIGQFQESHGKEVDSGASPYEVQVATDSRFANIVAAQAGLTESQWIVEQLQDIFQKVP